MRRHVPSWVPPAVLAAGAVVVFAAGLWAIYQVVAWLCTLVIYALVGIALLGVGGAELGEPYVNQPPATVYPSVT